MTETGAVSERSLSWVGGSSAWPVRLENGQLKVRGAEKGRFRWSDRWITVERNVLAYDGVGTDQGPILVYTTDDRNWTVVQLFYATGAKRNQRTFQQPTAILWGGEFGALLKVGERCYDYSWNRLKPVKCRD